MSSWLSDQVSHSLITDVLVSMEAIFVWIDPNFCFLSHVTILDRLLIFYFIVAIVTDPFGVCFMTEICFRGGWVGIPFKELLHLFIFKFKLGQGPIGIMPFIQWKGSLG